MYLQKCDDCGTSSVAANDVCLNCNTRWIYVSNVSTRSKVLLFLIWIIATIGWTWFCFNGL